MERKRQLSLSELKVGIFVLIACTVLAAAIFTIGTQVGLFESTFAAKTYLNNVSGLKPGDIVLLAGVEAGNVTEVRVSKPVETVSTQQNQRNIELISLLSEKTRQLEGRVAAAQATVTHLTRQQVAAAQQYGVESRQAKQEDAELRRAQLELDNMISALDEAQEAIENAEANLQNIVVYMEVKDEYRGWIKRDSNISLGSIGLLGDRYIDLSLGRSNLPPITIKEEFDTFFGKQSRDVVVITGTRQADFQELITGADDVIANFEVLTRKLQNIMDRFEQGEGSVGKFFTDPSFYNNLNDAVIGARSSIDQASSLIQSIAQGEGTVPKLIQERELYDKLNDAMGGLATVIAAIEKGEGALGKFVTDPSLYQKSNEVMANLGGITQRIHAGQGTLGKLSTDEKLYQDMTRSLDQLARFMADIDQGKGTLGRLAKDEKLYQNLNQLSSEVMKLLYDFRQDPKKFLTIKFEIF
ncbi:MAG: hypothetical protein HY645_13650 [Acidobacteria bacterium]|nr:hypothetical protein [Acidobacteriota bacterium]